MILPEYIEVFHDETEYMQSLCMEYLQMGASRSLNKLDKALKAKGDIFAIATLDYYSSEFGWVDRAALYDAKHYEMREQAIIKAEKAKVIEWNIMDHVEVQGRLSRIARFEMPVSASELGFSVNEQEVLSNHPYMIKGLRPTKNGYEMQLHNAMDALKILHAQYLEEAKILKEAELKGIGGVGSLQPISADRTSIMLALLEAHSEDDAVRTFDKIAPLLNFEQK